MSDHDPYQAAATAFLAEQFDGTVTDALVASMTAESCLRAAVDAARAPLLAEVQRLKAQQAVAETQGYDLVGLQFELDAARAEVERLKANQQPDGGVWDVEYEAPDGSDGPYWSDVHWFDSTRQRDVWYGPPKPIEEPAQIDSELSGVRRSTPDPLEA